MPAELSLACQRRNPGGSLRAPTFGGIMKYKDLKVRLKEIVKALDTDELTVVQQKGLLEELREGVELLSLVDYVEKIPEEKTNVRTKRTSTKKTSS